MAIVINPVAGTLDAVVVDDNFAALENQFREYLQANDFDFTGLGNKIDTFRIRRYTGGKLRNAIIGSLPELPRELQVRHGVFESNFKHVGNGPTSALYASNFLNAGNPRAWEVYEQLGRPGESFFFDFQEDGIPTPTGVAGWPPSFWEPHRFPEDQCWTKWLTIPHAAGKFYVERHCVAKVIACCKGVPCFSPHYFMNLGLGSVDAAQQFAAGMVRLGLFVDTNPLLWSDEFNTSNPHVNGPMASYKKFSDMTFRASPKGDYVIVGEVALKGRRSYNFSLRNMRANTYGFIDQEGATTFWDYDWESSALPNYDLNLLNYYPLWAYYPLGISLHTLLWLGSSIHIQFNYIRDETWINDYENAEFVYGPGTVFPGYPPYGE